MQHIKNFKTVEPTVERLKLYKTEGYPIPHFLQSEDGQDWYECQASFADDTVKVMYDSSGIIRSVVAAPVPLRGNTYAVSMLFPLDMSVVEIALADYPAKCTIDGTWKFDGTSVYQDSDIIAANTLRKNQATNSALVMKTVIPIITIQASAANNNPRDGDSESLLALQQYLDELRDVDLTLTDPDWPVFPVQS